MGNGAIGEMRSDWNRRIFSIASCVGMNITGVKGLNEGTIANKHFTYDRAVLH
ncbi:MAG: hypothetical protein NT070_04180 [Cyanobacteria bacterium]|nr:hypothetical protein [Cyanobacteriota bacterium]